MTARTPSSTNPPTTEREAHGRSRVALHEIDETLRFHKAILLGTWLPRWVINRTAWGFALPLWIPTAALSTVTLWSWWPAGYGPGRCHKCGYDLSGSPKGHCPECGHAAGAKA